MRYECAQLTFGSFRAAFDVHRATFGRYFVPVHCSAINSHNTRSNISWSQYPKSCTHENRVDAHKWNVKWNIRTNEKKRNYRYTYVNGCKMNNLLCEYKIAFCNDRMSWPLLHNLKHKEFNSTVFFSSARFFFLFRALIRMNSGRSWPCAKTYNYASQLLAQMIRFGIPFICVSNASCTFILLWLFSASSSFFALLDQHPLDCTANWFLHTRPPLVHTVHFAHLAVCDHWRLHVCFSSKWWNTIPFFFRFLFVYV